MNYSGKIKRLEKKLTPKVEHFPPPPPGIEESMAIAIKAWREKYGDKTPEQVIQEHELSDPDQQASEDDAGEESER